MKSIDLKNPTVAALRKAGNLAGAATALEVSKGTIGKRLRDLGTTSTAVLAYVAPAPTPKPAKSAPKAAPSGERYERITGKVLVLEGPSRFIKVDAEHPAAVAMGIVKAEGGSVEAGPSGLKLMDSQGRCFAIAATTKSKAHFYVQRVDQATAEGAAPNLGNWSCCWPNRNEGCAVLRDVTKVTKGMIRNLMRLHAANAVDGRTKAARAKAA
jgi:hypothetical protein